MAALLVAGMAVLASAGPASAQGAPLTFSANCDSVAGAPAPRTGGLVEVPAGTIVNNGAPEPVRRFESTLNAMVVFPNGTRATLNQVTIVGATATRSAIVITGGTGMGQVVGQVTCTATTSMAAALVGSAITVNCPPTQNSASGAATQNSVTVTGPAGARCTAAPTITTAEADGQFAITGLYPLAVDVAGASGATPDLASVPASTGGDGPATGTLVIGGAVILAALAQLAVWRRRRNVTTG